MRSAQSADNDLTTKARIRDAAIEQVATSGSPAFTVRGVAKIAGVSPALVLHHFGSKDGLAAACDAYVLERFHEVAIPGTSAAEVMATMDVEMELAPLARYAAESLRAGTPFAKVFMERLVVDSENYLQRSVAAGMVRPAGDERRRAEFLTMFSIGLLLLSPYLVPSGTPADDFKEIQRRYNPEILEFYTYGLFTDDTYLAAFRARQETDTHS